MTTPAAPLLNRPTPDPLDPSALDDLTRAYALDRSRWEPLVRFRPGRRWWVRLHGDERVDVWLLSWLTDQATELHDHGDSAASLVVVRGRLAEVRPDARGALGTVELLPGRVRRVPVGTLHDVRNTRPEPAVSIHAYAPPLTRMTYYAPDGAGQPTPVRTVHGDEPESDR